MATRRDTAQQRRDNVPDVVVDSKTGKTYKKGKFLGKVSILISICFFQVSNFKFNSTSFYSVSSTVSHNDE